METNNQPSQGNLDTQCPDCGQIYDRFDLLQVFRHEHRLFALPHFPYSYAVKTAQPFRYLTGHQLFAIN